MPVNINSWAVIGWRPVVNRWRPVVITWIIGRIRLRRLVHVEENPRRDMVFRGKHSTRPKEAGLRKLVRCQRKCLNDVLVSAEIVERSVPVTEDFQMNRSIADILSIRLDTGAALPRLNQNIVSDRP